MVRVARTREPQKLSFVRNPAGGSILAASAGGQAEAEFDFMNDSPDVAAFELAVDSLPADWLGGVGSAFGTMAAASGGGALRLSLTPPLDAPVGEYDFSVRILSGGDAIAPATKLILRVEPPDEAALLAAAPAAPVLPPPLPEPDAEIAPTPVSEPTIPKPATRRRTPIAETPAPVVEAPAAEVAPIPEPAPAPQQVVLPPPVVTPKPVARVSEPVVFAPEPTPAPRPEQVLPKPRLVAPPPTPEPEPVAFALEPAPTSTPTPTLVRPAQALPKPRPVAPPESEPVLVDYKPSFAPQATPEEEDETQARDEEPSVLDLPDGGALALKPGETKLLRFAFTNETPREVTYVLDEDHSLPDSWITLVQDQVNLTRNGKGDVALRLSPPLNAEPGDYPFSVTLGPQGGILTPRALTLTVQATAAVKLSTKETVVKIGPMASFADFHLTIESAGNADTAFRLGVRAPQTEDSPHSATPLYETPQWRYLFDKELETLRSPATGRAPRPVPIRLRLQHKGPWWFGFRENHQVHVAAVPVTEPANSGKPGNDLTVTAVRQRFWPLPYLTLIPLFLLLLIPGSGGAGDLSVIEGKYQYHDGATDVYWVATPGPQKDVSLEWTAPKTALLRLSGALGTTQVFSSPKLGGGDYTGHITMNSAERSQDYNYQISRLIGGGDHSVAVRFVQTSPITPLEVDDTTGAPRQLAGPEVTLRVPRGKTAKLTLKNDAKTFNSLNYWLVKPLSPTASFKFLYSKNEGSLQQHQADDYPIVGTGAVGDTDQVVFVTTDAAKPVLTVNLKIVAP